MKLSQLARVVRAEVAGSGDVEILAVTDTDHAHPQALVMVADARRLAAADASPAGALLLGADASATAKPALRAANVRAAFARAVAALHPTVPPSPGTHPSAVVAADAEIGPDVAIGPLAVVGAGAVIGARTVVGAGATIGARVRIGADCVIHPHVTIYPHGVIGSRVILHSGAVIGADGFGYATEDGVHVKIPHVGHVVLEDDVEIGANTTVDRATLGETRIGRGTKIDNLVQVGHNCRIGEGALILGQAGLSGSVTIGPGALLVGQIGVKDHVTIGAGARLVGRASVTKDVPAGATVSGYPAQDHRQQLRFEAALRRVPEALERLEALETRLAGMLQRESESRPS